MSLLSKVRAKTSAPTNGAAGVQSPPPAPPAVAAPPPRAPIPPPPAQVATVHPPPPIPVVPAPSVPVTAFAPPPPPAPVLRRKMVIHDQDPLLQAGSEAALAAINSPMPSKAPPAAVMTSTPPPATQTASATPEPSGEAPKRRGRPMGSKNKKTMEKEALEGTEESNQALDATSDPGLKAAQADIEQQEAEEETMQAARLAMAKKVPQGPVPSEAERALKSTPLPKVLQVTEQPTTESGIQLFINAIPPMKFTNLDFYVRAAVRQLEEKFPDLDDIRCPPSADHKMGFGRWRGALAAMVRAQPPQPGTYVVFTRGNELSEVVAEALTPMADVTRGV